MVIRNLFDDLAPDAAREVFTSLVESAGLRLERIVSTGQATPAGEWYDQADDEWVILLRGRAGLVFHGDPEVCALTPGDYVHIPAHTRHRVAWTDAEASTVWLALHYRR